MSHQIHFLPRGYTVTVHPGETVLEALHRLGYTAPYACRNGNCHVCAARGLKGHPGTGARLEGANGSPDVLICKARPESDCELEMTNLYAPNEIPATEFAAQIARITPFTPEVFKIELLAPAGRLPAFHPGQYLQLLIPGLDGAFFSIANAPGGREIELHILVLPEQSSAKEILDYLQTHATVKVRMPMGRCCLTQLPEGPVVLLAAGTGFAQIKSLMEGLVAQGFSQPVTAVWGVRRARERYATDIFNAWSQRANVRCLSIDADNLDNEWNGHHGELIRALRDEPIDWSKAQVFASGSPAMVYSAMDMLVDKGLPTASFHSDVLEYAPR
ncbi:MAG: 2Fe-2S iron-sulfur cluster binding domain-containing protein [Hahellaceae bacterium]|nr:2Fe-2S iron-sulfur cluster binding domain-containing protein [Hahellaceae bacterium]